MRRRRNPGSERSVLERVRREGADKGLPYVVSTVHEYVEGDDADWLQERYTAGDYLAKQADEVWEMGDTLFDDEVDAANAYEILKVAALQLGGRPRYGRKSNHENQAEIRARQAVLRHASDERWTQRIPGGTERPPSSFDARALVRGAVVELEHARDPLVAMEIAMDHLDEDPHYYGRQGAQRNPATGERVRRIGARLCR